MIDLAQMNDKKLAQLIEDLKTEMELRENLKVDQNLKKLEENGTINALHAELNQLKSEIKAQSGEKKFEFTVPVTFTVNVNANEINDLYLDGFDVSHNDVFCNNVEAAVVSGFDKKTTKLFNTGLKDLIYRWCDDIYGLFPGFIDEKKDIAKRVNAFFKKLRKHNLELDDLNG